VKQTQSVYSLWASVFEDVKPLTFVERYQVSLGVPSLTLILTLHSIPTYSAVNAVLLTKTRIIRINRKQQVRGALLNLGISTT
jgi:hypothetical protein